MAETNNVPEPVATTPPVSQEQGTPAVQGQAATTAPTPSWKPEEVEKWKSASSDYDYLKTWLDTQAPDIRDAILARHEGRTKPPQPLQAEAPKPQEKVEPITAEVQELKQIVQRIASEKTREEAEKEVQQTLQKYPFVGDRDKLEAAYKEAAKERFNQKIFSGLNPVTARQETESEMNSLPLEYVVFEKFKPQYQEYLVKSRTQGTLPPGVGSRGDSVNNGQSGFTPGFFEGKSKAFREASGNVDRQYEVVEQTAREMGVDSNSEEGLDMLRKIETSLRNNNPKLLGG